MRKMISYNILYASDSSTESITNLAEKVNEYIGYGWQPLGSASISDIRIMQTMVKYEDVEYQPQLTQERAIKV